MIHEHSHESGAVQTLVIENGWTVIQIFFKRITFTLHFSVLGSKSCYKCEVERVETFFLLAGKIVLKHYYSNQWSLFFDIFCTPSKNKYAWIGLDEEQVIFLNDFCWASGLIPWETFHVLLEWGVVHIPLPKNRFSKDLTLFSDIIVFAT